jgi:hypothetical protein
MNERPRTRTGRARDLAVDVTGRGYKRGCVASIESVGGVGAVAHGAWFVDPAAWRGNRRVGCACNPPLRASVRHVMGCKGNPSYEVHVEWMNRVRFMDAPR